MMEIFLETAAPELSTACLNDDGFTPYQLLQQRPDLTQSLEEIFGAVMLRHGTRIGQALESEVTEHAPFGNELLVELDSFASDGAAVSHIEEYLDAAEELYFDATDRLEDSIDD